MKIQLILTIEFLRTLKNPFLLPHNETLIFLSILMLSATLLLLNNLSTHISSEYVIQTLIHHWITKIGPSQNLVTD